MPGINAASPSAPPRQTKAPAAWQGLLLIGVKPSDIVLFNFLDNRDIGMTVPLLPLVLHMTMFASLRVLGISASCKIFLSIYREDKLFATFNTNEELRLKTGFHHSPSLERL
jgi:hypothetical protein